MPNWYPKPETELDDVLTQVLLQMAQEVELSPSFGSVVGMDPDRLADHAAKAIATMLTANSAEERLAMLSNPNVLVQIYSFGFVIGLKVGEHRAKVREEGSTTPTE